MLVQNMRKFPISINSFFQWYHFLIKLSIPVTHKFQKIKSDALVLIKLCLPVTSINLTSFIRVFVPFLLSWIMEFSWDVCFCLFFVAFTVVISFLAFIPGKNFTSSGKDGAASTGVAELIIRKITVSLLWHWRLYITHRKCQSKKFL